MNWKAFDADDLGRMERVIDAPLEQQKDVVEYLAQHLETSARLALDALDAIFEAGFVIVPGDGISTKE